METLNIDVTGTSAVVLIAQPTGNPQTVIIHSIDFLVSAAVVVKLLAVKGSTTRTVRTMALDAPGYSRHATPDNPWLRLRPGEGLSVQLESDIRVTGGGLYRLA
jgi:hypothetical protein